MKILLTGGAGFVGSHLDDGLRADGHSVFVVDRLDFGVCGTRHPNMQIDTFDMVHADYDGIDVVVHCAAHADVSRNWIGPKEGDGRAERGRCMRENLTATQDILEKARHISHFVLLSTCAVYGDFHNGTEERAYESSSPYAASKLAAESIVQAFSFARDFSYHAIRLGCVVGSRYHHGHVADFVKMAKLGQLTPRNNGMGLKSFVHVADVVDAVRLMVNSDQVPSGVYNVVNSEPWCPRDTQRVMGCEADWPNNTHGWTGDPMAIASGDKLGAHYRPHRSIESGVRDALTSLGWP